MHDIWLDGNIKLEIQFDGVVLSTNQESLRISHEALEKLFDKQAVIEHHIIEQQKEYEAWLEEVGHAV